MEFQTYSNGKRTINATPVMYENLYKAEGYKPVKASVNVDKSRGSRNDKSENSTDSTTKATGE